MVLIESDGEEGLADDGGESSCCGAMRRLNTVMNMAAAPEHLIKLACLIDIFDPVISLGGRLRESSSIKNRLVTIGLPTFPATTAVITPGTTTARHGGNGTHT